MSYIITINYVDNKVEKVEDVNDVTFVGEYMILCLIDLKMRVVRHLSGMKQYKIVEQPVKKVIKKK